MGILISQYTDPYKPTSIMESNKFFFVAHLVKKIDVEDNVYKIITFQLVYLVFFHIPSGCLGFLNHQQYHPVENLPTSIGVVSSCHGCLSKVGEALNLGSYPIDWCFDYEHGFWAAYYRRLTSDPRYR